MSTRNLKPFEFSAVRNAFHRTPLDFRTTESIDPVSRVTHCRVTLLEPVEALHEVSRISN